MLAAVIPLFISLLLRYLPSGFTITMLDVGQGDSFVIQNGYDTFIIDGGGLPNRDYGKNTGAQVVAPYLDYLGISEVAVFVTHPDNDHIAGILELFPKKNIRQVYLSKTIDRSDPLYLQLMGLCEESNARVDYLSKGGIVESGTVRFNVIYPMDAIQTKGNESSLVIQVKQQKFSVLFTGDISADIENALSFDSPSILKLAHHGSKYSNSHEFVKAVNPPFALVSAGRNNMYNHPSAEVLEFFYNSGIPIYNTQTSGAVILKINKNIRVREMIKTEGTKKRY
jgi:competence protein ComEC